MVGTTCDCVFGLLFISDLLFEILDGVELLVIDSGCFDALIDALLRLTAGLYAHSLKIQMQVKRVNLLKIIRLCCFSFFLVLFTK